MAAISKASLLMTLMAVILSLVGTAQAQTAESPTPSATSAALSTSSSLGWALLCSVVARLRICAQGLRVFLSLEVHKELQDTMAQLEVIRHEIRGISFINPGPLTRRLMDEPKDPASNIESGNRPPDQCEEAQKPTNAMMKDHSFKTSGFVDLHSQATAFARLAESETLKTGSLSTITEKENIIDESALFTVLPISAESTGMLPDRKGSAKGSDIVLEAVLEAEVARNAKDFFSQPQNQIERIDSAPSNY